MLSGKVYIKSAGDANFCSRVLVPTQSGDSVTEIVVNVEKKKKKEEE